MCVWVFIHVLYIHMYISVKHMSIFKALELIRCPIYTQIDFHQSNIIISNLKQKIEKIFSLHSLEQNYSIFRKSKHIRIISN